MPLWPAGARNTARIATYAVSMLSVLSSTKAQAIDDGERAKVLRPTTTFSTAERWETLSGGSATNRTRFDRDAFSQPSANLSFAERGGFFLGNGLFRRNWVTAPSSTRSADGLGPLYNARACQRCHLKDGRGHPPSGPDDSRVSLLVRLSVPKHPPQASSHFETLPEPNYGNQLQDVATAGHRPEGWIAIRHHSRRVRLAGGTTAVLLQPRYRIENLGYGSLHPNVLMSPRVAPPMIGLGLLEAIDERDLLAREDAADRDADGISGRANRVWSRSRQRTMVGRFGWKAAEPTLDDQSAAAMSGDLGISTPLRPGAWGDCTKTQRACREATHGNPKAGEPEVSVDIMNAIVFYVRNLAVPARRNANAPEVLRGKAAFYRAGCPGCHTPKHATRRDYAVSALAGQLIWPYSDLLLHDMGEALADGRPEASASGREWRTAPLWGIGLTATVNGHTRFLHDGRARNLTEAILWHGGEAEPAREAFRHFPAGEREALLSFLRSL